MYGEIEAFVTKKRCLVDIPLQEDVLFDAAQILVFVHQEVRYLMTTVVSHAHEKSQC